MILPYPQYVFFKPFLQEDAYEDLEKYDTIDEVLGKNNGAVILFQNESANAGHWVSLWKKDNTIMYFDSYGLNVDEEIQFKLLFQLN